MRWIWIDKFLEFRSGQFARAVKNLTLAEEHLHDHFPGYPVMPASLIIEGLAQTGGILVGEAGGFAEKVVLAKIPRAEFFGVACAGDQLIYEVTLTDLRSEGAVVEAKAFLAGELLADAEIVFAHLDRSRANQIFGPKNFVFTQQMLGILDLAKAQARAEAAASSGAAGSAPAALNGQPGEPPAAAPCRPGPPSLSEANPRHQRPPCPELDDVTMPRPERRVLITGLGVICPIGSTPEAVWSALAEGRGAVDRLRAFPVEGVPIDFGAEVAGFDPKAFALPRLRKAMGKSLKYMARDIQLAVAAAQVAVADAGLADGGVDPTRLGVDLGAGLISTELDELAPAIDRAYEAGGGDEFDYTAYAREGIPLIPPIWLLKYLPNMLACHISILLDCQGPSNTITEGEAASNVAIAEAARIIARGRADVMITGGADSKIHPMSLIRMALLDQMARWDGPPSAACRPFDAARGGWVPGEGAGILILEEAEHAARRGAKVYGEILGAGSGCDARPGGDLDPEGAGTEVALRAALRSAGLGPADVGHVHAHGIATPVSDLAESRAFRRIFGAASVPPVTSLKGHVGNLGSGSGAVETIVSLVGVNRRLIPPVLNCDEPDPACGPLDLVRGSPRPTDNPTFVNTNITRYGQAAALVVRGNPSAS